MHRTSAPTSRRSRNPRHSTADSEHPFPPISTNRPIQHSGWRTENRLKNKPENSSWSLPELESRWTSRTLVRPIPDSTPSSWPTRRARTRRRSLSTSTNTFINPQTNIFNYFYFRFYIFLQHAAHYNYERKKRRKIFRLCYHCGSCDNRRAAASVCT